MIKPICALGSFGVLNEPLGGVFRHVNLLVLKRLAGCAPVFDLS
jgi:hypothetical protein